MFCSRNCTYAGAKMRNYGEGECAECGASFKKYSRMHRFCPAHLKGKKTILRKCLLCKSHYIGAKGQKYCGRRCSSKAATPFQEKWTAGEVAYLAQRNPSFGFTKFCRTLYNNRSSNGKDYIFGVLEALRETNGFDYYGHLQERQRDDWPQGRDAGNSSRVKRATSPAFNWGVFADDPRVVGEEE
jgi:hypothetical protein